jgi:type I restriction enzyme S subunit
MKESGVEWLGQVPEHWEVLLLKRVATVQTGLAKGKDVSGVECIEVPYLRVANVQDGYIDLSDIATIEVPIAEFDRYRLRKGDVLSTKVAISTSSAEGTFGMARLIPVSTRTMSSPSDLTQRCPTG